MVSLTSCPNEYSQCPLMSFGGKSLSLKFQGGMAPPYYQPASASSGLGSTMSSDGGEVPTSQPPSLDLSMRYSEEDEKLHVHVHGAIRVPLNIYGGANDTYVQILVVKDLKKRWRPRSDIPLDDLLQILSASHASSAASTASSDSGRSGAASLQSPYEVAEFKTQLIRRKVNPIFNEQFVATVLRKDKKFTCVKFVLRSIDRFSHHSIVGTCHIGLASFGNGPSEVPAMDEFSIALQPYTPVRIAFFFLVRECRPPPNACNES